MSESANKKWRCTVCGYIHEGPFPPDVCPRCGALDTQFEPCQEAPPPESDDFTC
ncbi:MAG: rubrerythrin family protein [Sedimentisphaerales bacterium]|nr:rubrerythrin family protein [Sedimentisphaerales bacterium]